MTTMSAEKALEFYGANAVEWLRRWDAGEFVWTIEMGGLGPGYEQCIQITCAETLRFLLEKQYLVLKLLAEPEAWRAAQEEIDHALRTNPAVTVLRLSGAQASAAKNLAWNLYKDGPTSVMLDERVKDRHIQASRNFPEGRTA